MTDRQLWRRGAMVHDGTELYEVLGYRTIGTLNPRRWLDVENCRTDQLQHFSEADVDELLTLVRAAPAKHQLAQT